VEAPSPGTIINSPLKVQGRARGIWFFEGDFPLILMDRRQKVIAKGFATAKGEWMTRDFVSFEGTLKFERPKDCGRGTLVFKKDNPTDRAELDDAVEIPIFFK
jgi:hypothetical protein